MNIRKILHWHPIAIVVALTAICATAHANLFVNPGFETGDATGWTVGGGSGAVTNAQAHSGTFSFAGFSSDNIAQTFAPIATSTIAELSFWGRRAGGLFDLVTLTYSDATSEDVLVNLIGQGDDWTFVDLTSALDPGKSLTGFRIFGTSDGPAFLDDFTLTAERVISEPSARALLVLALIASGLALRRRGA